MRMARVLGELQKTFRFRLLSQFLLRFQSSAMDAPLNSD